MTEKRKSLNLIGIDPGSVNLGVGGIRFYGLVDLVDEDGNVIEHLPDVEIITMEKWDIERGIVHKPTNSMNTMQKIPLVGHPTRSDRMMDWSDSATQAITRSDWMFEEFQSFLTDEVLLPILAIENQCDQQKTNFKKNVMSQVQSIITASLQAIEYRDKWLNRPVMKRLYYQHMRKYGQRSDASRDRPERKEKGVDDLKELLLKLNTVNSLRWLAYLNHLESKREQIHDMCDAILLAIDMALSLYDEHLKSQKMNSTDKGEKASLQKERRKIPFAPVQKRKMEGEPGFTDDHLPDEEDCAPPKKRKKRSPSEIAVAKSAKEPKEPKARKRKRSSKEDEKEEEVKPKSKSKKASQEGEAKPKRIYKKRTKKEEEYPKLLLDMTVDDY